MCTDSEIFDTSYVYVYEKVYENNETIKRSSQNVFPLDCYQQGKPLVAVRNVLEETFQVCIKLL